MKKDLRSENVKKIAEVFPMCITEIKDKDGNLKKVIDFEKLKELLTGELRDREEAYEFTWAGKREALHKAFEYNDKILRPVVNDSLNFFDTQNIYIEGDNLDVLKILRRSYFEKVKMIYIDPPYNTGHDFIYKDDFKKSKEEEEEEIGLWDEEDNMLFENKESNGKFHSDWCSMIYSRLLLARDLLRSDGVIFISIDDNEVASLRKICDEVFGEDNFVAEIAWQCLDTIKNDAKYFSGNHEYILGYAKYIDLLKIQGIKKGEKQRAYYKNYDNDYRGDYLLTPLHAKSGTANSIYSYTFSNGQTWTPPAGTFPRFSITTLKSLDDDNRIYLDPNKIKTPQKKTFFSEVGDRMPPVTFWDYETFGSTRQSNKELSSLINKGIFQNSKPIKTIKIIIDILSPPPPRVA